MQKLSPEALSEFTSRIAVPISLMSRSVQRQLTSLGDVINHGFRARELFVDAVNILERLSKNTSLMAAGTDQDDINLWLLNEELTKQFTPEQMTELHKAGEILRRTDASILFGVSHFGFSPRSDFGAGIASLGIALAIIDERFRDVDFTNPDLDITDTNSFPPVLFGGESDVLVSQSVSD